MSRPTLAVDASVAVKWILPEEGGNAAWEVLEMYQDEELDLIAPYLLVSEAGNVLWKKVRRGDLSDKQALTCFHELLLNSPILFDSPGLNVSALRLATAHGCTFYDCLYLALALEQRCDLLTADTRFFTALRPAFPCLRLLGNSGPARAGGLA